MKLKCNFLGFFVTNQEKFKKIAFVTRSQQIEENNLNFSLWIDIINIFVEKLYIY